MSNSDIYHQAMLLQSFLNKNPDAKKYKDKDINLTINSISERLFSEHLMYHLKNNVECNRPLAFDVKDRPAVQLYVFVYFYPPFEFYHKAKGFDRINLYGKPLTDELLEVWYKYSLQYTLNSLVIDVKYNTISSPVTAEYLVSHINTMVLRHIDGRFPDDMFKSLTYQAAALHAMKISYLSKEYDHEFDIACLELIKQAIVECPDLNLESFGLDESSFKQVENGTLKGKNAFHYSIKYKLIDEQMLEKYDMLLPDIHYNKHLTHQFLTLGTQFEKLIAPKSSFEYYKNEFLRFLANIGNNEKTS